jgi:ABC-type glycerol-3-phosphate transport system permease component
MIETKIERKLTEVNSPVNIKMKHSIKVWTTLTLFSLIAIVMMFPLFWMFSSSLKERSQIFLNPPMWIPETLQWANFTELFTNRFFDKVLLNSFFVSGVYTIGGVFFCTLAGFAFAKYNFKFKNILFLIVLSSMMIPHEATMIPLFEVYRSLGLIDNLWGVILPGLANAFGIFFMRQYCSSIPQDLLESARIDGCTEFRLFYKVILPNLKPALGTLGIIFFVNQWNNFLWPMIILRSPENQTIAVAVRALQSGVRTPYELIMAGSVISILPLLFIIFFFQKWLIAGLLEGSIKG